MTGNDIIELAKSIYSVETFLSQASLVKFVNQAREKVNKLMQLTYGEYSFTTVATYWRYLLDKNFYEIHRATVDIGNSLIVPLEKKKEGEFPLRDKVLSMFPVQYAFTPMNELTLYPVPDKGYPIYLYGYVPLDFSYTTDNLGTNDVIPDIYLKPIAYDMASDLARFDQKYELATLFEQEFYTQLKIAKI